MSLGPGQLPTLVMALLGAIMDGVTAFAPNALNADEKTAIISIATAAIPVGLGLYGLFRHQASMQQRAQQHEAKMYEISLRNQAAMSEHAPLGTLPSAAVGHP